MNTYEFSCIVPTAFGGDGYSRRKVAMIEATNRQAAIREMRKIVQYPYTHGERWQIQIVGNRSGRALGKVSEL